MCGRCFRPTCWRLLLLLLLLLLLAGALFPPTTATAAESEHLASIIVKLNPAGPKKAGDVLVLTVVDRKDPSKVAGSFTWDEPKDSDVGTFVQVPLDKPIPLKEIGGYDLVITRKSGKVRYYNGGGAVMGSTAAGAKHILYQPTGEIALAKDEKQVRVELEVPR